MYNKTIEESIITALEFNSTDMIKYIPYIFQDFWELGTPSEEIIKIIRKHKNNYEKLSVLDLGSGKGAVLIKIASELKCKCLGIDAMDDFVVFSNKKAEENSVNYICTFETNDIRSRISTLGKYDIIILGAIGPILGDYYATVTKLAPHLNSGGIIIFDDAYVDDNCETRYSNVLRKSDLMEQIKKAGMELIEKIYNEEIIGINEKYENEYKNIQIRCMELIKKHPEDEAKFFEYIERQKREYAMLKNDFICVILVIKKIV